jgi:hypothetical protein
MDSYKLGISIHQDYSEFSLSGNGVTYKESTDSGVDQAKDVARMYYGSEWNEETNIVFKKIVSKNLTKETIKHHHSSLGLIYKGLGRYVLDNLIPLKIGKVLQNIPKNNTLLLYLNDGASSIPWELIHTAENFICLDHVIGRVQKDRNPVEPTRERFIPMLIVADPTGNLYGAQTEANYIIGQFRGSNLRISRYGSEIRKNHYVDLLKSGRYEIIHYSGHSASDNEQGMSHHSFLDGNLYGYEIESLSTYKMPKLVFSNSCQSAESSLGKTSTGNSSLAGSYLKAGVGGCIAAIWPVSDTGSGYFASDFYRYLLFGSTIGEAILWSRRNAFKRWGFMDFIWGSYILFGDPSMRLVKRI